MDLKVKDIPTYPYLPPYYKKCIIIIGKIDTFIIIFYFYIFVYILLTLYLSCSVGTEYTDVRGISLKHFEKGGHLPLLIIMGRGAPTPLNMMGRGAPTPLNMLGGGSPSERIKSPFLDYEMCTLQKVGGEDRKGRRV